MSLKPGPGETLLSPNPNFPILERRLAERVISGLRPQLPDAKLIHGHAVQPEADTGSLARRDRAIFRLERVQQQPLKVFRILIDRGVLGGQCIRPCCNKMDMDVRAPVWRDQDVKGGLSVSRWHPLPASSRASASVWRMLAGHFSI